MQFTREVMILMSIVMMLIVSMAVRQSLDASEQQAWIEPVTGMEFVWIPEGCFQMGSPESERGSYQFDYEGPVHEVCVDGFWLGKYEVTQAQWEAIMGNNPSFFKGENRPVEQVSWNDAQAFVQKLNAMGAEKSGTSQEAATAPMSYRLPTEAEWEYAARAGTQTAYHFGDDADRIGDYAWYALNSGAETHPVGQKQPNAWGLHDIYGNVREWCEDASGKYSQHVRQNPLMINSRTDDRVARGGHWDSDAKFMRSAYRKFHPSSFRNFVIGFRMVRIK